MNKTTAEIIMVAKGNHPFKRKNYYKYEDLKMYYADRCICTEDDYTPYILINIIKEAVLDYSRTCTNPTELLYHYFDSREYLQNYLSFNKSEMAQKIADNPTLKEVEAWLNAFARLKVKDGDSYINGFSDELCQDVRSYDPGKEAITIDDVDDDSNYPWFDD